ncbi:MAG: hypothetical protein ACI83N_000693 [Hydrogenophaga sp.]|jgi:hypothetical protein
MTFQPENTQASGVGGLRTHRLTGPDAPKTTSKLSIFLTMRPLIEQPEYLQKS